ncbi:AI-2E family transporter [Lichenicoccus sp.]|uniref:AI-2E family transporter n=1 Tax=Lichenicoccus sp. TaxID=2781899 RepID=UPI003D13E817
MRRIDLPTAAPVRVQAAEVPSLRALLTLQVGVVVIAALMLARSVLIPITLSLLLGFVLAPLIVLLRRARLGRVPASVVAVLLALGLIGGMLWLIAGQLVSLGAEVVRHQAVIERKLAVLRAAGAGARWQSVKHIRAEFERLIGVTVPPGPFGQHITLSQSGPSAMDLLRDAAASILPPLATAAVVLVVTVFILLQREDLRDRVIRLFGARDLHRTTIAINDAATRLSRYFITQLAVNASFGAAIGIGLWLTGVPSPVLWGILATLLRFIPYLGSILAAILPVTLAAAIDPGWTRAIEAALLFLVLEPVVGQLVEPVVIGKRTGLSPVAVIIAATFWTWLWGPVGLVMSTPLTLCFVVIGRHVERLEFLDVLFGDRPALSPIEGFYQRLLAGDPNEAVEQAERMLRKRALSSYYDEVVIAGLRLADADASRGVLEEVLRVRMLDAIVDLLAELDEYDDVDPDRAPTPDAAPVDDTLPDEPGRHDAPQGRLDADDATLRPAWRTAQPVLCIPGMRAMDEAACLVLSQILTKHGIGVRAEPPEAATRAGIAELDNTQAAMICLCVVEAGAQAAHLRFATRRLRRIFPGVPVMVAFWPADLDAPAERRLREVVDADLHAASLREAVVLCLQQARALPLAAD